MQSADMILFRYARLQADDIIGLIDRPGFELNYLPGAHFTNMDQFYFQHG